jgi:hypothetical protein
MLLIPRLQFPRWASANEITDGLKRSYGEHVKPKTPEQIASSQNRRMPRRPQLLGAIAFSLTGFLWGCGGGHGGVIALAPVITDIDSATTASGTAGSAFIVDGSNFGTLSGSGTTSGYSVDFRDAASNSIVATATYAGSGWSSVYIKALVPSSGLKVGTTYKVTVTTPSATSNGVNFLVTASVALSPSTIAWGSTTALPAAIQGFPTVITPISTTSGSTSTFVYALGGNTAASGSVNGRDFNVATVYSNTLNDGTGGSIAGTLEATSWTTEANALPAPRGFAAGAVANGFNSKVSGSGTLYVLGGLDGNGAATNTVYYASLSSTGAVGAWAPTTALPQALYAFRAAVFRGRVYVAGGNAATDMPTATVYSAPINSDGTLGAWSTSLPSLQAPVAYHDLVTLGGVLYVLGGTGSAAVDPVSAAQSTGTVASVYYNSINPDGTLAGMTWTANPASLIKHVEKHTVVAIGSYVLVSGGLYNGASTGSTEESYATQSTTDASLGSFQGATGAHTISSTTGGYNFFNHSAALYVDPAGKPHVLILGGQNPGLAPAVQNGVWYMK